MDSPLKNIASYTGVFVTDKGVRVSGFHCIPEVYLLFTDEEKNMFTVTTSRFIALIIPFLRNEPIIAKEIHV